MKRKVIESSTGVDNVERIADLENTNFAQEEFIAERLQEKILLKMDDIPMVYGKST
jgi:hypothetical protein